MTWRRVAVPSLFAEQPRATWWWACRQRDYTFVWGALRQPNGAGATTACFAFNPFLKIPPAAAPAIVIAPNLGPEVLTGSTRLKAGTATKLVFEHVHHAGMARIGKVKGI